MDALGPFVGLGSGVDTWDPRHACSVCFRYFSECGLVFLNTKLGKTQTWCESKRLAGFKDGAKWVPLLLWYRYLPGQSKQERKPTRNDFCRSVLVMVWVV